ncbi:MULTISPECIES: hypothetical protein [unclassified Lactococcus]|uniref:hypothetical protein n=1 Tax=unclassified Lactococcus TaxID=2643510 RepID=UPI0011C96235|nr:MULTISPECIES: hypothetical protein [unclassified Lactococcus]MQW22844.1 hypothetical protein [Lactococcus sp. dk101]TXK44605.1 hypothetical protein FVP42_04965 [Lactococcus sp. dk310]TXK50458.1 hypothetical protein FVP43_04935 [Lactococcus sp. dk322]
MNKVLKLGLGLFAAAGAAHGVYHGYQDLVDVMRENLTVTIREHFSDEQILALWLFEDPKEAALFDAGLIVKSATDSVSADRAISLEIDAKTLEIKIISEELV